MARCRVPQLDYVFPGVLVFNIMSACAKHVFLLKNETKLKKRSAPHFTSRARGRPGPVVIDLPKDIQLYQAPFKGKGLLNFLWL